MYNKIAFVLALCFAFCTNAEAQSTPNGTITIVSEDSLNFTLFVNGVRKNNPPDYFVIAKNISGKTVPVTVSFQKQGLPTVSATLERTTDNDLYSVMKNEKGRIVVVPRTKPFTPPYRPEPVEPTNTNTSNTTNTNGNATNTATGSGGSSLDVRANNGRVTDVSSSTAGEFHDDGNTQGYKSANGKFSVSSNVRVVPVVPGLPGPLPTAEEVQQANAVYEASRGPLPGTLSFYSNDGYRFKLFVDGVQMNTVSQTNVVVRDVTQTILQVRAEFDDPSIPTVKQSITRTTRDGSYNIGRNHKGQFFITLTNGTGELNSSH